jgi:hypothetical protein
MILFAADVNANLIIVVIVIVIDTVVSSLAFSSQDFFLKTSRFFFSLTVC